MEQQEGQEPSQEPPRLEIPGSMRRPAVEPAVLPGSLWGKIDYILRQPDAIMESVKRSQDLGLLARVFVVSAIIAGAVYGVVMGGTNFLQGNPTTLATELLFMLTASVKVPVLFLVTLVIVLPPMYVSGIFSGMRLSFQQVSVILLSATAMAMITLASMSTVAFFFSVTTTTYEFMKLMHVLFFGYAGTAGIIFLARSFEYASDRLGQSSHFLFIVWFFLYAFVGTQLAWTLRPFIGTPDMPFMLFRDQGGNFYENIARTLQEVLR